MLMGQEIAVDAVADNKPRHIAIIMDGNGRWARKRGLPRVAGHRRGVETVKNMVPICGKRGIPYLTLFAFSSENWRRPSTEVKLLIELLHTTLETEMRRLHEHNVRLRVIGDLSRFPAKLQRKIDQAHHLTRDNKALNLTIAINYGGQWDMTQACRSIAQLVARGELSAEAITPALIESHLCTSELPPPDLFIRTGGEQRVSNFLLWQLAYTELYFCDTYWPDFDEHSVDRALEQFASRQRRFGKTGEQIKTGSELA
jgi:undecaprenyl diphosphate synthase